MTPPPEPRPGSADQILEWFAAAPTRIVERCCLFLDVDGTLIDFKNNPVEAIADPELTHLLQHAAERLDGALALISGRLLVTLDSMLHPLRLPASGLYGLERRDSNGVVHRRVPPRAALNPARLALGQFAAAHAGLVIEDKEVAIALHFRQVPALGAECRRVMYATAADLPPIYQIVEGAMVIEIVPAGTSKAIAVEEFLREPPFADRTPIALGDDFSDREAFAAVHRHGGVAVAVGQRIYGDYSLSDSRAARHWLTSLIEDDP